MGGSPENNDNNNNKSIKKKGVRVERLEVGIISGFRMEMACKYGDATTWYPKLQKKEGQFQCGWKGSRRKEEEEEKKKKMEV